jgi:hypothetical protein
LPAALACLGLVALLIFLSSAAHGHSLVNDVHEGHLQQVKRLGAKILKAQQDSSSQIIVTAAPAPGQGEAADPATTSKKAAPKSSHELVASPSPSPVPVAQNEHHIIEWRKHEGHSCQGYANGDSKDRDLEASKEACLQNDVCMAIECIHGNTHSCTLRGNNMPIEYAPADCYEMVEKTPDGRVLSTKVPDYYNKLLKEYPFQQCATQGGQQVNIILVRSQMSQHQEQLYHKHKDEILFIGISSMNDYPLGNDGKDWVGMFPGFLHMMRDPEKHFPSHVKYLLMSQSDFSLPNYPWRDYSVPKEYDFTYSASDCDVASDGNGWCGWSKNWSFVKQSLKIMCNPPYNLKGVLVATKSKDGRRAYTIPPECKDKMIQTSYIPDQRKFFDYIKKSKFVFLPQIHDASPRVSTQALALDVPILMNYYIMGGWKYVNDQTGEYFHDHTDFKDALDRILKGSDTPNHYNPKQWVLNNYGDETSGKRLLDWVQENFADRVKLPKGTKRLQI